MGKFKVKISGPDKEIFKYLRDIGYGIREAKETSLIQPSVIEFDEFNDFVECVKHFHGDSFDIETDVDFEEEQEDINKFQDLVSSFSEEDVEAVDEIYDENHLKNVELVNAILYWQQDKTTTTLECGNDTNHEPLLPGLDTETREVVLGCRDCDYVSYEIPENIITHFKENYKENE